MLGPQEPLAPEKVCGDPHLVAYLVSGYFVHSNAGHPGSRPACLEGLTQRIR